MFAHAIVELARWAPSGDNTQPWRFEVPSEREILVHAYDTRTECVYDLDGWASQLSHGALLETLCLAATRFRRRTKIAEITSESLQHIIYRVLLEEDPSVVEDPLVASICERTVQRGTMRPTPLTSIQKLALEESARPLTIQWFESLGARRSVASLNFNSAHIRMTIPEAYAVHRAVIDFNASTSDDRIPAASLGSGRLLLAMMRWAMVSWNRMERTNRIVGTVIPRLLLDTLPGLFCSAHFALIAPNESREIAARIEVGRCVQRFWLTATALGLQQQPSYTPLAFARYVREGRRFTRARRAKAEAERIAVELERLMGENQVRRVVWLGRLGPATPIQGRSLRLPLRDLIVTHAPNRLVYHYLDPQQGIGSAVDV